MGTEQKTEIKIIRIFGERNSGTNFMEQLCTNNFTCQTIKSLGYPSGHVDEWKHGEPAIDMYGDNKHILYIFIFRDLESWLKSFFNYQWHVKKIDNFDTFLTAKQAIGGYIEYNGQTGKYVNETDIGKDIFEIRYQKCLMLLDFFNKLPNVVQVNLTYVQNNVKYFVDIVSSAFSIGRKPKFDPISLHTKVGGNIRNIDYKIKLSETAQKIIKEKKNDELEKIIMIPLVIKKNEIIVKS